MKKNGKKRNVIVLIAAIVALVLLSTSLVFALQSALKDEETSDKTTSSSSSSAVTGDEETDESEKPSTETDESESGDGSVEIETSEEKLMMQGAIECIGASLSIPAANTTSINPKLGFNFHLSNLTKLEIESGYELQILIAESSSFEKLNPSSLDYVDWLPLFKQSNYSYTLAEPTEFEKDGDVWLTRGVTSKIALALFNTEYVAVAVLDTGDGYQYSSYGNSKDKARSVAYIASGIYADYCFAVLCNYSTYSGSFDTDNTWYSKCVKTYVQGSWNIAKGFNAILFDSTYSFNAENTDIELSMGETYQINYSQTPSGVRLGYRFYTYITSSLFAKKDNSIITVNEDGVITAVGTGTAYVFVGGGGDYMLRKVTVT